MRGIIEQRGAVETHNNNHKQEKNLSASASDRPSPDEQPFGLVSGVFGMNIAIFLIPQRLFPLGEEASDYSLSPTGREIKGENE